MSKIFVSIACFMDPDVVNTIDNCFKQAKNPENITIGVCLQYNLTDTFFKKYENHPQVKLKTMHYKEAKGPMYARYFCTKLVTNEEYFLQIDCHTRFYKDWDEIIIEELKKCEKLHDKCVISHYPLNIKNMNNPTAIKSMGIIKTFRYINVDSIKSHGSIQPTPKMPQQSYGIMAAMKFMRVSCLKEVPYDLKTYHGYHGEEQFFYSVRLWSNGYNCYAPTRHILAMEYCTNRDRLTTEAKSHLVKNSRLWNQRTWRKCKYYMRLDSLENIDYDDYINDVLENQKIYGLGNKRSVIDYFKYVGLHDKLLNLFPFYKNYVNHKFHNNDFTHLLEINNPGKKIAIVTQNTRNLIRDYYKNTRINHIMYSNKYNYTYYVFYENLAETVNQGESPKICWSKVKSVLNVIENHDYVMWIDADAIFTNHNIKIEDRINQYPDKDYYLTKDPKTHFINSGVMIWKNSENSLNMLNKWWNMNHTSYGKGGDQAPLGDFLKKNTEYNKFWHHFNEREMNCYPTNYNPYDYIIHYMGSKSKININKRISNWNKYLKYENDKPLIYISITTIPTRIKGLKLLIDSFLSQTVKPDKIIFHFPKKYNLFESDNHLLLFNKLYKNYISEGTVDINVLDIDYGPCTKWQGMIEYYETNDLINKNFVSIVCHDDLIYKNYIIEECLKKHYENNRSIISGYNNFTKYGNNIRICVDNKMVHLLKGADLCLIPKYFFITNTNPTFKQVIENGLKDKEVKDFIYQDDQVITSFIHKKRINIISIYDTIKEKYNDNLSYNYNNYMQNLWVQKLDIGISHPANNKYNKKHIGTFLRNFSKYYNWKNYSNVDF